MANNELNLSLRLRVNADGSLRVLDNTRQDIDRLGQSADRSSHSQQQMGAALGNTASQALNLRGALASLAGGFAAVSLVVAGKGLIDYADSLKLIDARVKVATQSTADYAAANQALVVISLATHSSLSENANLFARTNKAIEQLGGSYQNTLAFTDLLAKSLKISGASMAESNSVTRQMSQAFASGVLRGDEFNSMMENSSRLAFALADGLHVGVGELRQMAEAGQLTAPKVLEGLLSQADALNAEFKQLPVTVAQAWQNVETQFGRYVHAANSAHDATSTLAAGIDGVALHLKPILDALLLLGEVVVWALVTKGAASLQAYATAALATRASTQMLALHSQALVMDAERTVQLTTATVADAQAQIAANQALLAGNLTMGERMGIMNQLNQQTLALTAATQAQTLAQQRLNALLTTATPKITAMTVAMAALNAAFTLFLGYQLGEWLNNFRFVSDGAVVGVGLMARSFEQLGYYIEYAKKAVTGDWSGLAALTQQHEKNGKAIDDNVLSVLAWRDALDKAGLSEAEFNQLTLSSQTSMQQFNKATDEKLKLMQQEAGVAKTLSDVHNEAIKQQIDGVKQLVDAKLTALELDKLTLEAAYKFGEISAKQRYEREIALIRQATQAKLTALAQQQALQKQFLTEQVADVDKAYAAIRRIESAGKSGQVNISHKADGSYNGTALGQGQATISTLLNPGYGMPSFKPAIDENIKAFREDYDKLKAFVIAHEDELNRWTEGYFKALVAHFGSIDKAVQAYGEHTPVYMAKFKQFYAELSGMAVQQMQSTAQQTALEAQKQKVIADGQKAERQAALQYRADAESYQTVLEHERLTLIQLTQDTETYNRAKAQSALAHNKDYQAAKLTNPNDAKLFEQVSQAKLLKENEAAAEAYQQRLADVTQQTKELGLTSTEAFDLIHQGAGGVANAFDNLSKSLASVNEAIKQNALAAKEDAKDTTLTEAQRIKLAEAHANEQQRLQQEYLAQELTGARQIAGATAAMFGEKTAAAKAFHGIEMALAVASIAMKVKEQAAAIATTTVKVAEGAATFFAESGWAGFAGVAAMLAVMAGLGFAASGSGTQVSAQQRQDTQGTGTVLGDAEAKSESISRSLESIKSTDLLMLPLTSQMAASLRSIEASLGGLGNLLVQSGRLVNPSWPGLGTTRNTLDGIAEAIGPVGGWLVENIFGKTTRSIEDSGLFFPRQTLGDIRTSGLLAQQYIDIKEKTDYLFGLFSSSSTHRELASLDSQTVDQLNKLILSIAGTVQTAAGYLSGSTADVEKQLDAFVLDIGNISLKGLSGDKLTQALNAVFSKAADQMALTGFGLLRPFQRVGEGYFETLTRVATGVEQAKTALAKFGLTAINYTQVLDKQADVATEIARQTIIGAEKAHSGLSQIVAGFSGSFQELLDLTKKLYDLRAQLHDVKLAIDLDQTLINAAGGSDSLAKNLSVYQQDFFSANEQARIGVANLTTAFANLGELAPTTTQQFRDLIERAQKDTSEAGKTHLGELLAQTSALSEVIKTNSQLIAQAKSNLQQAYQAQAGDIQKTIDKFAQFSVSLKAFKTSLTASDLSTLTPAQKLAQARAEYQKTVAAAITGVGQARDDALAKLPTVAQAFLETSRSFNASGSAYQADYQAVLTAVDKAITGADASKTVAEQQLDNLKAQVKGLIDINQSVQSVKAAIEQLTAAQKATAFPSVDVQAAHVNVVNFQKYEAARRKLYDDAIAATAGAYATNLFRINNAANVMDDNHYTGISKHFWSVAGSFDAQSGARKSGLETVASGLHANELKASLQAQDGIFAKVSGLMALITKNLEHLTGGVLPDVKLAITKSGANYQFGDKTGAVTGDNMARLLALFTKDAASLLTPAAKTIDFTDLASGMYALTTALKQQEKPFKTDDYHANTDYAGLLATLLNTPKSADKVPDTEVTSLAKPLKKLDGGATLKPIDHAAKNTQAIISAQRADTHKVIDELKAANKELTEQNKHLAAAVVVLQNGFQKLIAHNKDELDELGSINRNLRKAVKV